MTGCVDPSFLTGANATFIAELYARYLADPSSVDPSWIPYFNELADDIESVHNDFVETPWAKRGTQVIGVPDPDAKPATVAESLKEGAEDLAGTGASEEEIRKRIVDSIRALMMIRVYRVRGHLMCDLDPLKMNEPEQHPELDYRSYGFTEDDLDREIYMDNVLGMEKATLRKIIQAVQATYCGTIGVEYMHIQDPAQKAWIQERIEGTFNQTRFTPEGKRSILERLTEAEGFERYLQLKYTGTKRFGLEGGETMIPAIEQILKRGSQLGVKEVVLGMAHRGRLNMLTNIMHKPYRAMFSEFQGNPANPEDVQGSGDVKYHMGTSADREFDGEGVHLSLTANPSHLEAVDPVVLGKVRAKQDQRNDTERKEVLALLVHGDAAFAGQGIIAECFELSQLAGYATGGTVHFVINNQIGFTTAPQYSRSSPYCTDVAKLVQAPIFHVNGDDPEAVVHASRIAIEFRQEFKTDVVVDMVCYRRHGHNESDEPAFTQPIMYRKIARHPTTRQLYAKQLEQEGVINADEGNALVASFIEYMDAEFEAGKTYLPNKADWLEGRWKGLTQRFDDDETNAEETSYAEDKTGVPMEEIEAVVKAITSVPDGFNVNRKIQRQLEAKKKMFETGEGIDWATAEALAFGTLAMEGTPIRLSGQDCGRGTFSQRHARLTDQDTGERFEPLNRISEDQAYFEVLDSPLSELAVLGFEYGYSLAEPHQLVLWEGQFGDFANGAQVIMDQFISSAESKWLRMSGLVMLLPHGYEGQGPEHSSARLERYLQLCAEDNMQVGNFTTPANYFHALRRQMRRNYRKPLVLMTPKSMLRDKRMTSPLSDFLPGTRFMRTLPEEDTSLVADDKIRRVILCSGKIYFDLVAGREERGVDDVAIIRVEQLYPWPKNTLVKHLSRYPNAEFFWVQEEPANMGSWLFVQPRLSFLMEEMGHKDPRPTYMGRRAAASPATGLNRHHVEEQARIVEYALTGKREDLFQPFRRSTQLAKLIPQGSVKK